MNFVEDRIGNRKYRYIYGDTYALYREMPVVGKMERRWRYVELSGVSSKTDLHVQSGRSFFLLLAWQSYLLYVSTHLYIYTWQLNSRSCNTPCSHSNCNRMTGCNAYLNLTSLTHDSLLTRICSS